MKSLFNVEELGKNPCVQKVGIQSMKLTTAFRIRLFQAWKENRNVETIVRMLDENGITRELTYDTYALSVEQGFKMSGFPAYTASELRMMTGYVEENPLVLSGKYVQVANGIRIASDFEEEIFLVWPNLSIEESLRHAGIDPVDVGYQRIQTLKRKFEGRIARENVRHAYMYEEDDEEPEETVSEPDASNESWNNPYVRGGAGAAFLENVF